MRSKIDFLMLVFLWFNLVISQLELDDLIEIDSSVISQRLLPFVAPATP